MRVFTVKDHTDSESIHLAIDKDSAIQSHLVHFGLLGLYEVPEVDKGIPLKDWRDRSRICWDTYCCLVGASEAKMDRPELSMKNVMLTMEKPK